VGASHYVSAFSKPTFLFCPRSQKSTQSTR
jgi:hypothetical protein